MATRRQRSRQVIAQGASVLEVRIFDAFRAAVGTGIGANANKYFTAMLGSIENSVGSKTAFTSAHRRIAQEMKTSVVASYDQRVTGRKEFESYRIGDNRYSGGALRRALRAGDMFIATGQTIQMGNIKTLDQEARHWYRLNFGAGSAWNELYGPKSFNVKFGRKLGSIALTQAPSGPVLMPKGVWEVGGGKRAPGFYPTGRALVRETRGIPGRRFFDAGVQTFARELPVVYEDLLIQFADQAVRTGKGALARSKIDVRAIFPNLKF